MCCCCMANSRRLRIDGGFRDDDDDAAGVVDELGVCSEAEVSGSMALRWIVVEALPSFCCCCVPSMVAKLCPRLRSRLFRDGSCGGGVGADNGKSDAGAPLFFFGGFVVVVCCCCCCCCCCGGGGVAALRGGNGGICLG